MQRMQRWLCTRWFQGMQEWVYLIVYNNNLLMNFNIKACEFIPVRMLANVLRIKRKVSFHYRMSQQLWWVFSLQFSNRMQCGQMSRWLLPYIGQAVFRSVCTSSDCNVFCITLYIYLQLVYKNTCVVWDACFAACSAAASSQCSRCDAVDATEDRAACTLCNAGYTLKDGNEFKDCISKSNYLV